MSRQNKQFKKMVIAKAITALRGPSKDTKTGHVTMTGKRGPSSTAPIKRAGRHKDPDRIAARAAALAEIRTARYAATRRRWGKDAEVTPW